MKKPNNQRITNLLNKAQKKVGLDGWVIKWTWGKCDYEGDIEIRFTEKSALVTLDASKIPNYRILRRTIYHELLHCILEPIERGVSDFAEYYIKDKKTRDVFYEQLNTRQNETIDHIITKILGL